MYSFQIIFKFAVSWIMFMVLTTMSYGQQSGLKGQWEGIFMEQFRVVLYLAHQEGSPGENRIKMFDGAQMIQDDVIINLEVEKDYKLAFFIPAKNTRFEGIWQKDNDMIVGGFIFPDGSRHALSVQRSSDEGLSTAPIQHKNIGNPLKVVFSPTQLAEDVVFLREKLNSLHPQYHYYTSKHAFESAYASLMHELDRDMTLGEFYTHLAPVVAMVGCSHTGIRFSQDVRDVLSHTDGYFPLKLFLKEDRAWVAGKGRDQIPVPPGAEILRIDNTPVANIIETLLAFIPSEGLNRPAKYFELNRHFQDYFFLLNSSDQFHIEYLEPGVPEIKTASLNAVSGEEVKGNEEMSPEWNSIQFLTDTAMNTGLLRIHSFAIADINQYINLMDSLFLLMKKQHLDNLILDLRGNAGGHPIFAAILYSYLTEEAFTYFKRVEGVPDFEPLYNPMPPSEYHFEGRCYVLTDAGCLSTTGHLISLLKYHNRAIFIGEEPGSWYRCNDNSKQIVLPHTRLEANIPRSTFQTCISVTDPDEHFEMDFLVNRKISEIILNEDQDLDLAYKLIVEQNN